MKNSQGFKTRNKGEIKLKQPVKLKSLPAFFGIFAPFLQGMYFTLPCNRE